MLCVNPPCLPPIKLTFDVSIYVILLYFTLSDTDPAVYIIMRQTIERGIRRPTPGLVKCMLLPQTCTETTSLFSVEAHGKKLSYQDSSKNVSSLLLALLTRLWPRNIVLW